MGTLQSPDAGSLVPDRTRFPLYKIRHSSMSNMILHPASQNFRVATRDECANPGTIWASVMSFGSHGMSRLQVCVDLMTVPSGNRILSGLFVGRSFFMAAPFTNPE